MNAIKTFDDAVSELNTDDGCERLAGFRMMDTDVLIAIARGDIDAVAVARAVLAGRGMVANGAGNTAAWAGFANAEKFWRNY